MDSIPNRRSTCFLCFFVLVLIRFQMFFLLALLGWTPGNSGNLSFFPLSFVLCQETSICTYLDNLQSGWKHEGFRNREGFGMNIRLAKHTPNLNPHSHAGQVHDVNTLSTVCELPAVPFVHLRSRSNSAEIEKWLVPVPVHIVTQASQLPAAFLEPDEKQPLIIGFDCEGVNLARHGRLCIMQLAFEDAVYLVDAVEGGNALMQACKPALESTYITKVVHDCKRDSEALYFQYDIKLHNVFDSQIAYTLIEEQQGKTWAPDDYISFVGLLAHERYCGVVYDEKEEVRSLLKKDPQFWTHRPWTAMMMRVAADDVRFLLCIHEKMMKKLDKYSLWQLNVRGCLYCRCFCDVGGDFTDWPSPHPISDYLGSGEAILHEEEVLAVVNVVPGRMGRIIGKKGASILSIKQSCRASIFMGGAKGPPDKVFVIGALKEVRKAEAILRGRML